MNAAAPALVLLILLGSSFVASPASATTIGSGPLPESFFGITISNSVTKWPVPVTFGTAGKTAAGSTTIGTYWAALEPENGTYDWTPMDNLMAAAHAAGVGTVMYTFFETPTWASSNQTQSCSATASTGIYGCAAPPKNINDWAAFVTALVTRYKGEIQYYELWNEPNVSTEFSGTVQQMVAMAQVAYPIIKSIDPSAIVLTPGVAVGGIEPYSPGCALDQCWLAEYLQDGGAAYADGVAFHGKTCLSDESICTQEGIACSSTQLEQCAGTSLVNQITDIRAIMQTYGLESKPLIDTEGGYSDEVGEDNLWGSTDQQAAFVSRFFILQAFEGLAVAVYFSWLTNPNAGLMGFGTTSAMAATDQAYTQTYDWLLGMSLQAPCTLANGYWSCTMSNSQNQQESLVWADTNSSASSFAAPPGEYQTLNGTVRPVPQDGTIPINEDPELVIASTATASSTSSTSVSTVPEFPSQMLLPVLALSLAAAAWASKYHRG